MVRVVVRIHLVLQHVLAHAHASRQRRHTAWISVDNPINHILDAHVVTPGKTPFFSVSNKRMIRSCDFTNTALEKENPSPERGKVARHKREEKPG
jgi:hypothetical protein